MYLEGWQAVDTIEGEPDQLEERLAEQRRTLCSGETGIRACTLSALKVEIKGEVFHSVLRGLWVRLSVNTLFLGGIAVFQTSRPQVSPAEPQLMDNE